MREAKDDWLELGRDLTSRGMPAPRMIVADGAPGLISAIEEAWPRADRQRCAAHPAQLARSRRLLVGRSECCYLGKRQSYIHPHRSPPRGAA
jgi:hypothetical protein